MIVARCKTLRNLNGGVYGDAERRDCELYYMKRVYREFLELKGIKSLESVQDPELAAYAAANHPRFYELCGKFGSPADLVSVQKEGTTISTTTAKVKIESACEATMGKILNKKLLLSMTVDALKGMCATLFKTNKMNIELIYREEGYDEDYPLDEDQRVLSFFNIKEGGLIICKQIM